MQRGLQLLKTVEFEATDDLDGTLPNALQHEIDVAGNDAHLVEIDGPNRVATARVEVLVGRTHCAPEFLQRIRG
jgi:hypothetical protein